MPPQDGRPYLIVMAYVETLQEIGLSPNEARIYEALLELGESSVSAIATRTNIHRRNVYDAVNRLVEKNLITPVISEKEGHYVAVEPEKLLEIIEEKRAGLQSALPGLQKLFQQKRAREGAFIFKGIGGFKSIARDILRIGGNVYTIGGKRAWLDPYPEKDPFMEEWLKAMKKRGMKFESLLDATAKKDYLVSPRTTNTEYRFFPEEYSSPAAIDVYGDRVAIYLGNLEQVSENWTVFLIVSAELAESYKKWFRFMWERCKPIEKGK